MPNNFENILLIIFFFFFGVEDSSGRGDTKSVLWACDGVDWDGIDWDGIDWDEIDWDGIWDDEGTWDVDWVVAWGVVWAGVAINVESYLIAKVRI